MTTELLERPHLDDGDTIDLEHHVWCHCSNDRTVCGLEIEAPQVPLQEIDPDTVSCTVCRDLMTRPCERCGCG